MVLHLAAKDDRDGPARLPVVISLVFEDQSALPAHAAPSAITGKTVNAVEGAANIKLSIKAMSSAHERRRFRIRVGPQDASLAAELPDLVQHTEPFSMVHTTAKMLGATPSSRGAGGAGASPLRRRHPLAQRLRAGGPRPPIGSCRGRRRTSSAPASATATSPPKACARRRRRPPRRRAAAWAAGSRSRAAPSACATASPSSSRTSSRAARGTTPAAARTGAAAGDGSGRARGRAGAGVARQGRPRDAGIVADDVLAVATRPGQYDFSHVSGALGKWLLTNAPTLDPAAPFFPDGVAPPPPRRRRRR